MNELAKTLTAIRGASIMINIVVGAGLLALPGLVVEVAGDHALWAWAACALAALPLLAVFLIIGKSFPDAGGIAHFAKTAFGTRAYIVSVFIFLGAVAFGLPAIALTGGYYIGEFAGGNPATYAILLLIGASSVHLISTDIAGRIATAVASCVVISLLALTLLGFYGINWNEASSSVVPFSEIDTSLVFAPFMMIFFAFTGWEVAAGISEEFKNPKRDFPIAMILSFVAVCILYFLMAFLMQSTQIDGAYEAVFASIASATFGPVAKLGIVILASLIIFANLMGAIWAVSRMVYSLSREGYLPISLETSESGMPMSSVILTTGVLLAVLLISQFGIFNINTMLTLAGQNFFILSAVAGAALLKLSKSYIERSIAALAVVVVVTLMVLHGTSIWYPIALAAISGVYSFSIGLKKQIV